jgi:glycolate oxidase iron-sulfur subunit
LTVEHAGAGHATPEHAGAQGRGIFTPELLERCISCGFCLPACPTYALTQQEPSSPRGRINLMRSLESGRLPDDDPTVVDESSFCLGCRACEPVCPAGVHYGALLEEWRDHMWGARRRGFKVGVLLWGIRRRWHLRAIGFFVPHARRRDADGPWLMLGCVERFMFPSTSRAAAKVAPGLRVTPTQGCCGALHAHNGELERGREMARALGEELPGTIVTTSGGCSAHLAETIGRDRVKEFSEWVAAENLAVRGGDGKKLRVGLQDSCHLRNGLRVWLEPRAVIEQIADYVELPSAASCCGSAGTYSVLRPKDSARVLDKHLDEIAEADLDVLATVNPGCLRQLRQGVKKRGLRTRVVHLAELLAEARAG